MHELRDYQKEILEDESQFKAVRKGRRVGASYMLAAALAKQATENPWSRSVCVTPMKWAATLIADYVLEMVDIPKEVEAVDRHSSIVAKLKFKNGAEIDFVDPATPLRGHSYDLYVVDEAENGRIPLREIYLLALEADAKIIMTGTPVRRLVTDTIFKTLAESDNFTQWHLPSRISPHWSQKNEDEMRKVFSEDAFRTEIEAEWPEPTSITIQEAF